MRIGLDATGWSGRRGAGRIARNVTRGLTELESDDAYLALCLERDVEALDLAPEVERLPVRSRAAATRRAFRADLDVLVFPTVDTWFPTVRVPTVVGVLDTIAYRMPREHFPNRRAELRWRVKEELAVRSARRVFTISEAARREVGERFGVDPAVALLAPEGVFFPRQPSEVERVLEERRLTPDRYVLFAGGINRRKGIDTLVEAHAVACAGRDDPPPLVVVGDLMRRPAYVRELRDRAGSTLVFTGHVSDDELACLYTGAAAVALPSTAEGFGLPAVEAAACGAPVAVSDIPSHRETLDGAALFFPPRSVDELAATLRELLDDSGVRRAVGERARGAVSRLSWRATAERVRAVIGDAVG